MGRIKQPRRGLWDRMVDEGVEGVEGVEEFKVESLGVEVLRV